MDNGVMVASSGLTGHPPLSLTPPGVRVGAVLLGKGEVLAELEGFGPTSSLYRITLQSDVSDALDAPEPIPDTLSPAGVATPPGDVVRGSFIKATAHSAIPVIRPAPTARLCATPVQVSWISVGSPLAVRGALVRSGSVLSLALRTQDIARLGSAAWLNTCRRLGLPSPPPDPNGPAIFSEWRCVATWEGIDDEVTPTRFVLRTLARPKL